MQTYTENVLNDIYSLSNPTHLDRLMASLQANSFSSVQDKRISRKVKLVL